jgi:hypothetical protein
VTGLKGKCPLQLFPHPLLCHLLQFGYPTTLSVSRLINQPRVCFANFYFQ